MSLFIHIRSILRNHLKIITTKFTKFFFLSIFQVLIIASAVATNNREDDDEQPRNLILFSLEKMMGRRRMPPHGGPGCYEGECMMVGDDDYQVGRPGSFDAAQCSLGHSELSYTTSCCHHIIPSPPILNEYHCTQPNNCIPNTSNNSSSRNCFENSIITATTTTSNTIILKMRPNRQMSF